MKFVDPDGNAIHILVGAGIGAAVGGIAAAATGGSLREIAAAAVGGAVTGGLAAATGGMSLGAQIAGSAMAGTAGYCAQQFVAGESSSAGGMVSSAMSGASGAMAGAVLGKVAAAISGKIATSGSCNAVSSSESTTQKVFWTGIGDDGTKAMSWAKSNGGTTLEMTEAINNLPVWSPDVASCWDKVSRDFARNATGDVTVLVGPKGISSGSTFGRVEFQELLNNKNVTSITFKYLE